MKNVRKISLFLIFFSIILLCFYWLHKSGCTIFLSKQKPQPYITVFIHGTFGSVLGFLNASDVLKDKISGTMYRKITRGMRDDNFFFRYQPILRRGLVKVDPTFDLNVTGNQFLAAYPLIQAYEVVNQTVRPGKEHNFYYTFGWSGLMSQNSRRFEAIRLYNALSEELEKFHAQGIYPKIRLITHSHGGNLCLNLAAVSQIINLKNFSAIHEFSKDREANDSLKIMYAIMRTLPSKDAVRCQPDQKRLAYIPTNKNLYIDELILLGTPIQPETERFVCSPAFKKVYNFYSGEDFIQKFDWVTSKRAYSFQRVHEIKVEKEKKVACVTQVKIMIEKQQFAQGFKQVASNGDQVTHEKTVNTAEKNIWEQLLAGENIFARKSKDPTHKELWFFCWKDSDQEYTTFLAHLPTFVLTPIFLALLEKTCDACKDIDINTHIDDKHLVVSAASHNQEKALDKIMVPLKTIDEIKQKTKVWKPDRWKSFDEFKEMRKHL